MSTQKNDLSIEAGYDRNNVYEFFDHLCEKMFNLFQSKPFSVEKMHTAKSRYMMTKYGKDESDSDRFNNVMKNINDMITAKSAMHEYVTIYELPDDMDNENADKVVSILRDKGYNVIQMSKDLDSHKTTKKDVIFNNYIMIGWNYEH